jgi:hypothetical protein
MLRQAVYQEVVIDLHAVDYAVVRLLPTWIEMQLAVQSVGG